MTNEDLYQEVINDLEISRKNFEADSSQFNRRTYIRTFVSFLEAFIDIFKNKLATEWQNSIIETTPELMANYLILIGKHPNLSGAGEAKLKDSRGNLLSLSKLTIRTYCQLKSIKDADNAFSWPGYKEFEKTLALRNKLTHPKPGTSYNIELSAIHDAFEAEKWLKNVVGFMNDFENNQQGYQSKSSAASNKKLSIVVAYMLEFAQGGGMNSSVADKIYNSIMSQIDNLEFDASELFLAELRKIIEMEVT